MASASPTTSFSAFITSSSSYSPKLLSRTFFPFPQTPTIPHKIISSLRRFPNNNAVSTTPNAPPIETFTSRFAPDEPRKGCDVIVEALEGGIFAAEGYARAIGFPGVCMATSGPGATNLVSGLADAMMDSIPIVAITGIALVLLILLAVLLIHSVPIVAVTGQVPLRLIGTDSFQETPIVEVNRSITKHNYLVMDVHDIPRIVREAFFLARSGRPGPVLIDIPKDIQQQMVIPNWDQPMKLTGYMSRLPEPPKKMLLEQIVRLISESKKPVLYVGGGCIQSCEELRRFVELTGIPVASTLMGLGAFPTGDELSLQMLGMHGTVYSNYAVDSSDLLLAFGVRFDDRVTGKIEAFANRAKIVHIDIDAAEIGKNKQPHVSICADIKLALQGLNSILEREINKLKLDFSPWRKELTEKKLKYPLKYRTFGEAIPPQYAIQVLDELTNGNAIISTGVGQHRMWSAQYYKYKNPMQWLTSGGLGAMGFGLPAAMGAAVARPDAIVVDVDGDGSFMMNVQELATNKVENLPVKMLILNNQHSGMVVQWEDQFHKANRAHNYLRNPSNEAEIFPDMLKFAEACDIPAARVTKKNDVRGAIQKMLDTPGPYLLDVIVPHQENVLPMIPSGGAFKDIITEGDGRSSN
ncbi:acetolactate synthase 2, chloroplastic-like [Lycium barbarum]|uniref:acetolactate synthase 2, chloroplastic-like n=1 Tax=Lycium barbarum TaxID=112863 RepID=UPI00293F6CEA|nr:acetolactate synthase 2, chloroplastic-like [Lycium barbarum]